MDRCRISKWEVLLGAPDEDKDYQNEFWLIESKLCVLDYGIRTIYATIKEVDQTSL